MPDRKPAPRAPQGFDADPLLWIAACAILFIVGVVVTLAVTIPLWLTIARDLGTR